MFSYKINEIPQGKSTAEYRPEDGLLDLNGMVYKELRLLVAFERREFAIRVDMGVSAEILLNCDRSLEDYWQQIEGSYSILFKAGIDEEVEEAQMSVRRLDISGNIINIEDEVRDTILLAVPIRKVHPRFYDANGELTELELPQQSVDQIDPRWDALRSLKETNQ